MARLRGSNVRECEGLKKREKLWKECVRFRGRFSLERGKEVEPWALAIEEWMRQRREREREGGERKEAGRERECELKNVIYVYELPTVNNKL